jgi:hypothetical protein
VFRASGNVWTPVLSLAGTPSSPTSYARTLAADDGPTVDRIAMGPQSDTIGSLAVEVYADTGSGFALEQTLLAPTNGDPDIYSGALWANAIAMDGDLLAITSRGVEVPSAQVGHAAVKVGYVAIYRKGATWAREAEVPTFENPSPGGVTQSLPYRLQASGNHVAAMMFVSPDPPPGCNFPCFNFGFEAWSIDRTG